MRRIEARRVALGRRHQASLDHRQALAVLHREAKLTTWIYRIVLNLYSSGLAVVGQDAVRLFAEGVAAVADQVAPLLPAYMGAFALTLSALGLWWWAENY